MSSSPPSRPPFIANPFWGHWLVGTVPLLLSFSIYNPQDVKAVVIAKVCLALGLLGFVATGIHWIGIWCRWWGE